MFNIVERRGLFFTVSGLVIGLGILMMVIATIQTGSPFRLSIDFVGGSIYEFRFVEGGATEGAIRDVFAQNGEDSVVVQRLGGDVAEFRVAGDVAPEDVTAALDDALPEDLIAEVGTLEETYYTVTFTGEDVPDIEDIRVRFVDAGLASAFVREIGDDTDDEVQLSVVAPVGASDEVESLLDEINAETPLEYTALEGNVLDVTVDDETVTADTVRSALEGAGLDISLVQRQPYRWSVRGGFEDQATNEAILDDLEDLAALDRSSLSIRSVSETIGQEVTRAAFLAVALAAVVITGFIVIAFRQIPNAARYGLSAIAAMVHDVLIVMGVMSLMGIIAGWEIDALFLTAVLTVVGFSVQDSIVVFDRIRENIPRYIGEPYETIVNRSIWETIHRSLATQLNAFFVMIAILLFGGETIKEFIAILLIGLLSGTYSSIFTAVPLLVAWEKGEIPFLRGDEAIASAPEKA